MNERVPTWEESKPVDAIIPTWENSQPIPQKKTLSFQVPSLKLGVIPEPVIEIPEQPPEHPIYMADKSPEQWLAKNDLLNKQTEYKKRRMIRADELQNRINEGYFVNPEEVAQYSDLLELPDAPKPPKEKVPAGIYSKDLIARSQMEEMPIVPDQPAPWGGEPDTRQPIPLAEFTGVPDYVEPPPQKDLTLQPEPSMLSLAEEQGWDAMEHTAGSAFSSVAMAALNAAKGIVELNEKIPTPKFIKDIKTRIGVTALEEKGKEKVDDLISELGIYRQQMIDEIRKDGGVAAEVAQNIGDSALNTAAMLASLGVTGFTGAGATARAAALEAAKFGALTAATTPGSAKDRALAGAHSAVMMLMPVPMSKLPKDWMAKAANIIGLQGLSAIADMSAISRAKEQAAAKGTPDEWASELFAAGAPEFVINTIFGSLVKSAKNGKVEAQKLIDAMPNEIKKTIKKQTIGAVTPEKGILPMGEVAMGDEYSPKIEVAQKPVEIAKPPAEQPPKAVAKATELPVEPTITKEPIPEQPSPKPIPVIKKEPGPISEQPVSFRVQSKQGYEWEKRGNKWYRISYITKNGFPVEQRDELPSGDKKITWLEKNKIPVEQPVIKGVPDAVQEPVAKTMDVVAKAPDGKEVGKGNAKGEEVARAVEPPPQGKVAEVGKPRELMTPEEYKASLPDLAKQTLVGRKPDKNPWEYKILDIAEGTHATLLDEAITKEQSVSSSAVDTYNIKLPEGYVKEGDRYVFKPPAPAPAEVAPIMGNLYHGTDAKSVDVFQVPYGEEGVKRRTAKPLGVYLAESPDVAKFFGSTVINRTLRQGTKILDITKAKTVGEVLDTTKITLDPSTYFASRKDMLISHLGSQYNLIEGIGKRLVDSVKSQGYSGIRFLDKTGSTKHPTIVVFDPKDLTTASQTEAAQGKAKVAEVVTGADKLKAQGKVAEVAPAEPVYPLSRNEEKGGMVDKLGRLVVNGKLVESPVLPEGKPVEVAKPTPKPAEPTRQEQAKQGGFVATPPTMATPGRRMGDVADVIINSVKKNFTPSQGMNKTWNAIKDMFERSSDAGIEHAKKAASKLTFARNELLKLFDKKTVETDINSVLDNKLSVNDFTDKYKLRPDNEVVKELNWVLADRERVSNAAADQLEKAGQTEMAKLFRENANTYLTRFYEKWIMGDAFTPKQEDYNLAMTAVETRLVDDVSGTITKMEELKSKMSGKGIDTQKYFETGDESLIAGLTPEHQKTTRMLKDKYWGMKNLVRGDLSNLEVKADAIQTAAKDTLDYILTGKQISGKGASPIDVNHLTARDLTPIFRQLYGEIDTPIEKIQRTAEVQNNMLNGLILVNRLYDEGVGQWWSDRPSNLLSTKLTGARFGRLDGKFVSSQTASLLRAGSQTNAKGAELLWRGYEKTALPLMRYERIAQLGLSLPTTERNLLSGYLSYAMQSGDTLIEPALGAKSSFHKNIGKSIAFLAKYASSKKGSRAEIESLEVLEHLAELGIHHTADSGIAADIKVGLEGATAVKTWPAKVAKKLGDIYSYGDLITKYASFLTHMELNMAKGMSRPQAEQAAATHVQTFYQHARSLPIALRQFSKLPFADYPSFYFDAIRIKKNGIINAAKEAANGNVRPLIGFALSNGLYALSSSGVSSWVGGFLGRAFYGDGNENKKTMPNQLDYEQFNAIKEFQPDYWQRTPMVASRGKDKDGKPVIHYWIAGNLMGFPVDDAIIGAIQKRDAKTLLTELPTQLLKTGMTFNTLSKYILGQEVGYGASNYKSRGMLNWLTSEDPAKAKEAGYLLKDMIIELALPVPRRVQQNVKRWDEINEKVKAGKIQDAEGWEQKKDMLLSEILPVKCRSITQDVAKRMITNTIYPHIDVVKERTKTTSKASLGTTPTDTEKSKAIEAQEIINQEYNILANYVKKAKVAFKGILDDDLIMAILLDSGLSKTVVRALISGDLSIIPDYTEKTKKQKRFDMMTK